MAAPPLVDDRDIFIGGGEALHPLLRGSFARGHLHYIEGGGRGHVRLSTNNIPPPQPFHMRTYLPLIAPFWI